MSLRLYLDEFFNIGSEVDQVDTFVGNGSQTNFVLTRKTTARLTSTIQSESTQYLQFTGGFTKDSGTNSFTVNSAPPTNYQIVAPGINQITAVVFDQEDVPGRDDPRVDEVPFVLGDGSEIHLFQWNAAPAYSGIRVSLVDLISAVGAQTSWCQLASANIDGTFTWGATGNTLELGGLTAGGVMSSSISAGSMGIVVTAASANGWPSAVGGYIKLAPGTPSEEIRKITAVNSTTNTITLNDVTDFSHTSGAFAFHIGWPLGLRVTVPLNAASNTATNFYDIGITVDARGSAR